jgi:hypothetical protein
MIPDHVTGTGFLVVILVLLGMVLIGSLGDALQLKRWHPTLIGAVVGALVGVALIEAVPMLT